MASRPGSNPGHFGGRRVLSPPFEDCVSVSGCGSLFLYNGYTVPFHSAVPISFFLESLRLVLFKNWFTVSVRPSSYGCMRQVAKHEGSVSSTKSNLTLFYRILVPQNPLKAYKHAFQWLHCVISVSPYDYGARR